MGRMPPDKGRGPTNGRPSHDVAPQPHTQRQSIRQGSDGPLPTAVVARRRWAYKLISQAPEPPPTYGSHAWLGLPEGDRTKVAAVVVAAEAYARAGDDLVLDLTREVDERRRAHKLEEDSEYAERAAAHRQTAPKYARSCFLERRREQLEAAEPRPGDYQGRGGTA